MKIAKIRNSVRKRIGLAPIREVTLFTPGPSDRFLVSYPKSGNTWVRMLLAKLRKGESVCSLVEMDDLVPDVHFCPEYAIAAQKRNDNAIFKSHFAYQPEYRKVLYLVRDPRAVFISFFHHRQREAAQDLDIEEFLLEFIEPFGPYGNWGTNVASWVSVGMNEDWFKLVRYEDLKKHPKENLKEIADFFQLESHDELLDETIRSSTIKDLRKQETDESAVWEGRHSNNTAESFFRKGEAEAWRQEVPAAVAQRIAEEFAAEMKMVGYEA